MRSQSERARPYLDRTPQQAAAENRGRRLRPPIPLLERVRDGLRALPADPSAEGPWAQLPELARRLHAERPDVWAPPVLNEPPPDTVTTAALPILGEVAS